MGVIAVGVFCMNVQALTGTLFQIAAHATSTGILFLFVGLMEERMVTRDIDALGGIAYRAPIFATFFGIAMLASVGLPGTSGFIGEFLIILGAVKFNAFIGFLAGTTLIIGVCYMLWMFQRVFFEKTNNLTTAFQDLKPTEALSFLPVIILIIVMGVFPQIFIQKIEQKIDFDKISKLSDQFSQFHSEIDFYDDFDNEQLKGKSTYHSLIAYMQFLNK